MRPCSQQPCNQTSPPVTISTVQSFNVDAKFTTGFDPLHARGTVGAFLACLTLPFLAHLRFIRHDAPAPSWAHTQFVEFTLRSSLLTSFEVYAMIEEQELLDCLSLLHVLEELYLRDSAGQTFGDRPNVVITDNLLRGLTWSPNHPSLIPRLNFLCLTPSASVMSLLDCITSRIGPCRSNDSRFRAGGERGFCPEFVAQVSALEGLSFSVGRDDDFWSF
jgi:hypothetical protein